jgi:hypothetical protein
VAIARALGADDAAAWHADRPALEARLGNEQTHHLDTERLHARIKRVQLTRAEGVEPKEGQQTAGW